MSEPPHDYDPQLRKMRSAELLRWTTGWKPGCYPRIAGEEEIQRRRNVGNSMRGWIAIAIALLSLGFSIFAILHR
jgi:hypothetical protein